MGVRGAGCHAAQRPATGSGREKHQTGWVNTLRLGHLVLPASKPGFAGRYLLTKVGIGGAGGDGGARLTSPFELPSPAGMYEPGAALWPEAWTLTPPTDACREATLGQPAGDGALERCGLLRQWVQWACGPDSGLLPVPAPPTRRGVKRPVPGASR